MCSECFLRLTIFLHNLLSQRFKPLASLVPINQNLYLRIKNLKINGFLPLRPKKKMKERSQILGGTSLNNVQYTMKTEWMNLSYPALHNHPSFWIQIHQTINPIFVLIAQKTKKGVKENLTIAMCCNFFILGNIHKWNQHTYCKEVLPSPP